MASELLVKRHAELWEARNKRVKRLVIGGLLFGALLLFNVLKPYALQVGGAREDLANFQRERERAVAALDRLKPILASLNHIQQVIQEQPWMTKKDALIRQFHEMNMSGQPMTRAVYQAEADAVVRAVAEQVRNEVLKPLHMFYNAPDSLLAATLPDLAQALNGLPGAVDAWENENIGRRWYVTVATKGREMERLTDGLQNELGQAQTVLDRRLPELQKTKFSLVSTLLETQKKIQSAEETLSKKLDTEMARVMPGWTSGIVSISQMLHGFPFVIFGLTVYTLILGLSLVTHFKVRAQAEGLTPEEESLAIFSSIWTPVYRGKIGTLETGVVYVGFVVAMVVFFEQGMGALALWVPTAPEAMFSAGQLSALWWMCRVGFVAVVAYSVVRICRLNRSVTA